MGSESPQLRAETRSDGQWCQATSRRRGPCVSATPRPRPPDPFRGIPAVVPEPMNARLYRQIRKTGTTFCAVATNVVPPYGAGSHGTPLREFLRRDGQARAPAAAAPRDDPGGHVGPWIHDTA